ncbi:MAG: barstar family protein [Sedimentibacter sp.]
MEKIMLDGSKMTSKSTAHKYIKEALNFPIYYGENLDALWDMLSTISIPTSIYLTNEDKLKENLGEYGELFIDVFQEASCDNDNICFSIG